MGIMRTIMSGIQKVWRAFWEHDQHKEEYFKTILIFLIPLLLALILRYCTHHK